jgi:acyl carrier protein
VRNLYGPSEDTTYSTCHRLAGNGDQNLIGKPVGNRQAYVLDCNLSPVPVGVIGELHLAGDGLARGYLNRPGLTAEKFVANPYGEQAGARLYKTGDLARYHRDGNLEFLGRADGQLKIRGYRIELGEIDVVLGQHPGVREAVVMAHGEGSGRQLVAYLVCHDGSAPSMQELRTWLQEKLPDYMVPGKFVELSRLPLTPNGKVDHKAISLLNESSGTSPQGFKANQTEQILIEIWGELLALEEVGLNDNFFDLGGHSLLMVQVAKMIEQRLGSPIRVIHLFRYPTIATLASYLSVHQKMGQVPGPDQLQARVDRRNEYLNQIRARKSKTEQFIQ